MAKKKETGYLSAKESRRIAKENWKITDEFEKILEFHNNEGNKFEALAYRKVIGILKKYKEEINDVNKIPKIKGIGPKITEKIKEILLTGKCRKSDNVENDSKNKSIKEQFAMYKTHYLLKHPSFIYEFFSIITITMIEFFT